MPSPAVGRSTCLRRWSVAVALLLLSLLSPSRGSAQATGPTTIVAPGYSSAIADGRPAWYDPAVVFYTQPGCAPAPPSGPEEGTLDGIVPPASSGSSAPGGGNAPGDELLPAILYRTSTYLSTPRQLLYVNPPRAFGACNPYRLLSNIETDADAHYFLDNQGPGGVIALWRRLRNANAADPSTLLMTYPGVPPDFTGEIQVWNGVLFLIAHSDFDVMVEYDKLTGQLLADFVAYGNRFALKNMQVDERFLWWLNGGALWRNDLTNGQQIVAHPGFIDAYDVELYDVSCDPIHGCIESSRVVVARNNQLATLDTLPVVYPLFPIYTSTDPNARITDIIRAEPSGGNKYFFFERRAIGGGFSREDWLFRMSDDYMATAQLIYGPVNNGGPGFSGLRSDDTYVYFVDRAAKSLLQLPVTAAAIPLVALRATGLEVTQGLQDPAHSVRLVQGRRTFVRLYHKSDGVSSVGDVVGVLHVSGPGGYLGQLEPVNRIGKLLRAYTTPSRLTIDDSFMFELPLSWSAQTPLSFVGTVNPYRTKLELDTSNNSAVRSVSLETSPRLPLEIIDFAFNFGGALRTGGYLDNLNSTSWMSQLYPLAPGGSVFTAGPGLRRTTRMITDDGIVSWVDQSNDDCKKKYQDTKKGIDNRNMCAVDYALGRIRAMRAAGDLPQNRYYYAAIAQEAGVPFTRGFAPGGDKIAGGPSNDPNYMAHEIGHTLGRGHPGSGANPICPNQDASDPGYPYARARIGDSTTNAADATALLGLDAGDHGLSLKVLLPASTRGDTMSYCSPYWISDHTYEGLLDFMNANPVNAPEQTGAPIGGDWLIAVGGLSTSTAGGAFNELRRTDAVAEVPVLVPGPFRLELRDAGGVLASHSFTPEANEDAQVEVFTFLLVVPFEPGATQIRVVENGTNRVYFSKSVSANAPVVSNVALVSPPDPVSGVVTLAWDATDDDGDALRFDVMRTRDAGLSFEPVALSITTNTVDLDTAKWGGGTSALRVIASDGVLSGVGDGGSFSVEAKPPIVQVTTPADGLHVPWGTLVNFMAEVVDPQEAPIPNADIVWSNAYRILGTGLFASPTDLEVGTNLVTVTATNAAGLTAQASVTVVVGDDLRFPGPKISATPTTVPFSVGATEVIPQGGSLSITNAGGGSLSVSVASDSAWLTLDGGSVGTYNAPVTIALLVDPTALPDATTSTASITIQNNGDAGDALSIPVTVSKGAVFTATPFADDDGDGIENGLDNCAFAANADQGDTGGVGVGSPPDGIGNACQCGDLNGDGRVSIGDAVVLQRSLLQPPTATPARLDLCDVGGSAGCSIADATLIRRALLSPPTAFLTPACVLVPPPGS